MKLAQNLAGLETRRTDVLTLGGACYQGTDSLDIWIPSAASLAHRVRDVIAKTRAFATDVAV